MLSGKKSNLFLVLNDVLISSVSCSYSSLDIISITINCVHQLYFTWVRMYPAPWLTDNIASPVSAVVWIKPAGIQIGQILFTFMPCCGNSTSKSKDNLSESWHKNLSFPKVCCNQNGVCWFVWFCLVLVFLPLVL